ncbi:LysM peptidoglycan-binding domain-containing protein [Ligilactobacillus aviarius]|uniref:LysM peptidoglycan-binding domain-containing protein n=1 Tax=Ligilactobacillus aviarius TaxID=1606 RepID=UPI0024BB40FD|nr:LysM peptidoglycan-binding domain-containing protein [Ligilactobacillus aviarius]
MDNKTFKKMLLGMAMASPLALINSGNVHASSIKTNVETNWHANSLATVQQELRNQNINPDYKITNAKYIVQAGDTLSQIAAATHINMYHIAAVNHIQNLNLIYVGQVLILNQGNEVAHNVAGNGSTTAASIGNTYTLRSTSQQPVLNYYGHTQAQGTTGTPNVQRTANVNSQGAPAAKQPAKTIIPSTPSANNNNQNVKPATPTSNTGVNTGSHAGNTTGSTVTGNTTPSVSGSVNTGSHVAGNTSTNTGSTATSNTQGSASQTGSTATPNNSQKTPTIDSSSASSNTQQPAQSSSAQSGVSSSSQQTTTSSSSAQQPASSASSSASSSSQSTASTNSSSQSSASQQAPAQSSSSQSSASSSSQQPASSASSSSQSSTSSSASSSSQKTVDGYTLDNMPLSVFNDKKNLNAINNTFSGDAIENYFNNHIGKGNMTWDEAQQAQQNGQVTSAILAWNGQMLPTQMSQDMTKSNGVMANAEYDWRGALPVSYLNGNNQMTEINKQYGSLNGDTLNQVQSEKLTSYLNSLLNTYSSGKTTNSQLQAVADKRAEELTSYSHDGFENVNAQAEVLDDLGNINEFQNKNMFDILAHSSYGMYQWIYDDADSNWGHRDNLKNYNNWAFSIKVLSNGEVILIGEGQ